MIISFGKYKGKTIEYIFNLDRHYIEWLVTNIWYKERHTQLYNLSNKYIEEYNKNIVLSDIITVYTDGSCYNNGKPGAISGIGIHYSEKNKYKLNDISNKIIFNDDTIATNNHAELKAIEYAINDIINNKLSDKTIKIYTDSKYSLNCITKWYPKWLISNKLENRKNVEIIRSIYDKSNNLDIEFLHVKGHSRELDDHSIGNNIADKLSRKSYTIM